MDPLREVVFLEQANQVLRDRFELPLFFIVGGADDAYLSNLVGTSIRQLVVSKSQDGDIPGLMGVYASRALLPTIGKARTFPLSVFLNDRWPILSNIESFEVDTKVPTNVERTWIIRSLRRSGQNELANQIRSKMLHEIYPEKLEAKKVPTNLNMNTFGQLYLDLSENQRNYPMIILVDDLPIQLPTTIGSALKRLSLNGCTNIADLKALQTGIQLLQA